jgi:hypothetical protein
LAHLPEAADAVAHKRRRPVPWTSIVDVLTELEEVAALQR